MTQKEFLEEMHSFLEEKYSDLSWYKQQILEILSIFHSICEKNNIPYFVAYGSLLAQVRDDGFIPWDSDFDVCVPINVVSRLIQILEMELPESFFVESNFHDREYPYFQMRIGKKGKDINLLHLDVFYMIGLPKESKKKYQKSASNLFYLRMNRAYLSKLFKCKKTPMVILRIVVYFLRTRAISFKSIEKKFNKIAYKYDYNLTEWVGIFCDSEDVYPKNIIEPVKIKEYHGRKMMIPNDEIAALNIMYKDYKTYLPIEKRFEEFYNWVKREDRVFEEKIEW